MTTEVKEKVKNWCTVIKNPALLVKYGSKILMAYMLVVAIGAIKDITSSGFEGDFSLLDKTEEGWKIGQFKASKTIPDNTPMNLVNYSMGHHNSISVTYGRHVLNLGPFDVYGTGTILSKPQATEMMVGVTITF